MSKIKKMTANTNLKNAVEFARRDSISWILLDNCIISNLIKYEYRFCEARRWRLDIAIVSQSGKCYAGIEIHGATFTKGRHVRGFGFGNDREKINAAMCLDIPVLEIPGEWFSHGKEIFLRKQIAKFALYLEAKYGKRIINYDLRRLSDENGNRSKNKISDGISNRKGIEETRIRSEKK